MIAGNDYKTQVLQAVDIVELIGRSVALKRRGKDFVGLCPFHQEKTPSFHVSPSKQFFHCYGCKAGGNAIDFVIRRDRIEFLDAMNLLGREAGIDPPQFGGSKEKQGQRQRLFEANSAACAWFERMLADPKIGAEARKYLQQRRIDADSVRRFQIGFAPDAWDGLLQSPVGRKFTPEQLAAAGLVKARPRGDGYYDTFRNRLIFPIRDETGRVIAFGGRILPGSDEPAKYLNSPETPLFSKGRCIFGLDLARQKIVETRTVAVVEGYTDVVMAHQCGVPQVVSVLGTAMTEQHVSLLRRFADRIVLLFDADTAGDKAVDRAVELFLRQPVEIAIASMPDGVDPDEFLLANGPEAFEALLAGATDTLAYKWKRLVRQFISGDSDLTGQQKAVEQYLSLLAEARGAGPIDALRWGAAVTRVSRLTEIPADELNRRFRAKRPRGNKSNRAPAGPARPVDGPTDSASIESESPEAEVRPSRRATARDRAERWILGSLLAEPQRWQSVQQHVHPDDFTDEPRRRLAEIYWAHQRDEGEPEFNELLGLLGEPGLTELAIDLMGEIEALADLDQTLEAAMEHLNQARARQDDQKRVATIRRSAEGTLEQDPWALLQEMMQKKAPDLTRIGPDVRRGS